MAPTRKSRPVAGADFHETLTTTTDQSDHPQATACQVADHERRIRKLENTRPAKRKPKGCITNENGDVFMPGAGWIKRSVAV